MEGNKEDKDLEIAFEKENLEEVDKSNILDIKDYSKDEEKNLETKISELTNVLQRTQADFINYKRRTEEEKKTISLFANEKILLELLLVIDNFDRALSNENKSTESFFEGISLINKQIHSILEKNEVLEINTEIDFDPNLHYAVMQEDINEESNKILEVFQKGYLLKDKVLRPAMVKVSK